MTTAKKAAAKKATSSPSETDEKTTGLDDEQATAGSQEQGAEDPAAGGEPTGQSSQDSGPGTGRAAPPEDTDLRPPAHIVNTSPAAAPLSPPADHAGQTEPKQGHPTSTTDQVYAEAAGRTIAGENHLRLVDDDGNVFGPGDLFDESDTTKTFVVAKTRIVEEFTYPNTTRTASRLLFVPGTRVPRWQAERIKSAVAASASE